MNIFDVWIESWTTTDLYIFGAAGVLTFLFVFVRPIVNERRRSALEENGSTDH